MIKARGVLMLIVTEQPGVSMSLPVWCAFAMSSLNTSDSPCRLRSPASLSTWPTVSGLMFVFLRVSVRAVWPTKMINRCLMDFSSLLVSYRVSGSDHSRGVLFCGVWSVRLGILRLQWFSGFLQESSSRDWRGELLWDPSRLARKETSFHKS